MAQIKTKFMEILSSYIDDEGQKEQTADFLISNLEEDREEFINMMKNPEDEDDDAWPEELCDLVNQCFDYAESEAKKPKKKSINLKSLKTKISAKTTNESKKEDESESKKEDKSESKKDESKKNVKANLSIEVKKASPSKTKTKPMKIHNAYHMFGFEHRPKLQEKFDKKTENQKIEKELAKMWEETKKDPTKLQKYQAQAKEHNEEVIAFNDEHGFETKRRSPTKSETKGKISGYTMYFMTKRPEVAEANPDMKATEIMKQIGEMWNETTDEEKEQWKEDAEKKNEAEGRVNKSKTKSAEDKPKGKTDHYKMWMPIWKENFKQKNPDASTDKVREEMKEAWKEIKKDKSQLKIYQEMAERENEKRGFGIETK